MHTYLLPIRKESIAQMLSGKKVYEFRSVFTNFKDEKSQSNISPFIRAFMYESRGSFKSMGRMAVVADAYFDFPIQGDINLMYSLNNVSYGEKNDFISYFTYPHACTALPLIDISSVKPILTLDEIRKYVKGFNPPQKYYHLSNGNHPEIKKSPENIIHLKL